MMTKWFDSSATISIPAPVDRVYDLFSQLDQHPSWSPWLDKVSYNPTTGLSTWSLKTLGFNYSWRAKNIRMERPRIVQWESIDGLANKGKVEFSNNNDSKSSNMAGSYDTGSISTTVTLTVSFQLPDAAASFLSNLSSVNGFSEETLLADLRRFKARLLKEIRDERVKNIREVKK